MNKDTVKLMEDRGTFYVPTLYVVDWILEVGQSKGISAGSLAKARRVAEKHAQAVKMAYEYDVKMALGSDSLYPVELATREFDAMNQRLNDPWFVLRAGTINGAELLGISNEVGTLAVGKQADIVAMPKSPIADMKNIERVNFVMKGGKVIRQP